MARTTAGVAMMALLTAGIPARIDAAPDPQMVVVLHVNDRAHVSGGILAGAERQGTDVYDAAGVRVVWADGSAWRAQPDGAYHVDVVLLLNDAVAEERQSHGRTEQVLGSASGPTRRAYIFYNRILDYARKTGSSPAGVLGMVIAHEVGHLLLHEYSHSDSGIMRARWEGRIMRVPSFTVEQGATIRTRLATARR